MPEINLEVFQDTKRATHVSFVGMSGFGKTYAAEKFIAQLPKPVIILAADGDEVFDKYVQLPRLVDYPEWLRDKKSGNAVVVQGFLENPWQLFAYAESTSPCTIYIDEASLFVQTKMPKSLSNMLFVGRKKGQHVLWSAQRPQLVHSHLRAGTTHHVCFHLQDELSLSAMELSKDKRAIVEKLPPQHFILGKGMDSIFKK